MLECQLESLSLKSFPDLNAPGSSLHRSSCPYCFDGRVLKRLSLVHISFHKEDICSAIHSNHLPNLRSLEIRECDIKKYFILNANFNLTFLCIEDRYITEYELVFKIL